MHLVGRSFEQAELEGAAPEAALGRGRAAAPPQHLRRDGRAAAVWRGQGAEDGAGRGAGVGGGEAGQPGADQPRHQGAAEPGRGGGGVQPQLVLFIMRWQSVSRHSSHLSST